ncbi:MAG: GNAT family N-acetyltransferase [Clostridia bacterium]|nr:GNAT family N-acetyltransferase [Clostridia bacterium]
MTMRPLSESDYSAFEKLFCDYYAELDCEEDPLPLFNDYLLPDLKAGLFDVGVAEVDGAVVGFIIFQIDDLINDWNFKEGCGDVRELYVAPPFRRRGFGTALLQFAESALLKSGATEIYTLPVEECESFFAARGFTDSGEYCADADNKVFVKNIDKSDIV